MTKVSDILIWAHRGASGYAPENTMESFSEAVQRHADGIELDCHLTSDGYLVVSHDSEIDRCSNGTGVIEEMTLSELRRYDFNYHIAGFHDCRIPLLSDVYEYMLSSSAPFVNCEVKDANHGKIEPELVKLAKKMNMRGHMIYSCFNIDILDTLKNLDPECDIAYLFGKSIDGVGDDDDDIVAFALKHKLKALHPNFSYVKHCDIVEKASKYGIDVNAYTINKPEEISKAYSLGVHAIITNYPDIAYHLRDVYEK